jgi:taurine dioxygenase
MAGILRSVTLPSRGGDTLFANMYDAYETLSLSLRTMLDTLTAEHSVEVTAQRMARRNSANVAKPAAMAPTCVHPVVRTHPETGRKLLYVSSSWVTKIVELSEAESDALLHLLFEHVKTPELQIRLTWEPNMVTMWDNRATQHYGAGDYNEQRTLIRISLAGDVPFGPATEREHSI